MSDEKVINIRLTPKQKNKLEKMSKDFKIGQSTLAKMAVLSLLTNYEENGMKIWFDLIISSNTND